MGTSPIGYTRRDDATLEPDPTTVPIAKRAFEMRAEGASIPQIRAMLKSHDVERSHRGVQVMLASRVYLGEIHFGEMVDHCRVDAPLTFVSSAML